MKLPQTNGCVLKNYESFRNCLVLAVAIMMGLAVIFLPPFAEAENIPVGSGSYKWSLTGESYQPVSPQPLPVGVKAQLVGSSGAIQSSDWWTSLIYKRSTQSSVPMNIVNPGPLSIWSIPAGVGCRQYYYGYAVADPKNLPLNQGTPGLHPTAALGAGMAFNEVVAGIGISNNGYGFDQIGGTDGYGPSGQFPATAVVDYSTWAVTYDTCYKNIPWNTGSTTAPRLRATIARGSPYMWVEYPDGYPSPQDKPGYPGYPAGYPNFPWLQVQFTDTNLQALTSTVVYLPPSPDYTLATVSKDNSSNWVQNPVNNQPGTKNATGGNANAIAFTVNGRHYAAFGPPGTWWTWLYDPNFQGIVKLLLTYAQYDAATRPAIVVAALPPNVDLKTLAPPDLWALVGKFKQYAFKRPGNTGAPGSPSQVWGTKFQPTLNPNTSNPDLLVAGSVTGTFTYHLVNVGTGGAAPDNTTLFAFFPHQQANLQQVLGTTDPSIYTSNWKYTSSRGFATNQKEWGNSSFAGGAYNGQMHLAQGTGFVLHYTLPPLYPPALPLKYFRGDQARLTQCLAWDWDIAWAAGTKSGQDSYGWGKLLSAVANNYLIAKDLNYNGVGGTTNLATYLGNNLKFWLNAASGSGTYFAYDPNWNTLFPFPPGVNNDGYGVVSYLNDMHFHYGYFIRAAAVYAGHDPAFISSYGKMVEHLIRSIAADYNDQANGGLDLAVYPPYRFFDLYASSSSASGAQQYADGMNQESSSEGVNAWYGMLLWAKVTNDANLLARAAYLYASETDAARRYVFCEDAVVNNQFALISNTFSQLYDDTSQLALFFAQYKANPGDPAATLYAREAQHIINFLPFGGGSLYLAANRAYAGLNYQGMVNQPPGTNPYPNPVTPPYGENWQWYIDLIWMYRAISNPQEAQAQADAHIITPCLPKNPAPPNSLDNGNSLAMLYQWVNTLPNLGKSSQTGVLFLLLQ